MVRHRASSRGLNAPGWGLPALLLVLLGLLPGCDTLGNSGSNGVEYNYDFTASPHEWEAFFTDYPVGDAEDMELTSGHRPFPDSIRLSGKGLFISGVNQSDDLKMLFRRRVSGLEPGATYQAHFVVQFATNAPSGCPGVGGAPGEAVKVLAAASSAKPKPFVEEQSRRNWYRLNVQHQGDSQEWYQKAILGHIGNSRDCEQEAVFERKTLTSPTAHDTVTADEDGTAWLLFGTRSGFEGRTSLFYTHFRAELRR